MSQRGFTAVELAIVLSVAAVLVPVVYGFVAHTEDQTQLGHWHLDSAVGLRTAAEELGLDARRGEALDGDEVGFQVGGCAVRYRVNDASSLVRDAPEACGGPRGLATSVESVAWGRGGVELVFARTLRPGRVHRTTAFIPVSRP